MTTLSRSDFPVWRMLLIVLKEKTALFSQNLLYFLHNPLSYGQRISFIYNFALVLKSNLQLSIFSNFFFSRNTSDNFSSETRSPRSTGLQGTSISLKILQTVG